MKKKPTKGERTIAAARKRISGELHSLGNRKQIKAKAAAAAKHNKKAFALRIPAAVLNDIHEGIPVSMKEALRVISHLEDELEKKEILRNKEILDAIEKLRQSPPKKPEITDEMRRCYDAAMERARRQQERERPVSVPHWPHINLPPVIIQPWDPRYPFKPVCHI